MLIRQTLLYLPAQLIGPVVQFAAIFAFTHWMAPDAYGVFTYVLASQDFVFLLALQWWSQFTVRYFGDDTASYRRSEVPIVLGTIVLQIAAAWVALCTITAEISPLLAVTAVVYTVTRCLTLHLAERARAHQRILDYTLAQALGPAGGFLLAFVAVAVFAATPAAALAGYGLAQGAVLVWLALRQDISWTLGLPDRALLRQALGFGLPLIVAGLAAWFGVNVIRIFVDHRLGSEAMGLIAVGWGLGQRLTTTTAMFVTVAAFPLAVESLRLGARQRAYRQITSNGLLMFALVLPASVGLYLVQGPLVALFVAAPFRAMTLAVLPAALAAGLFRNIRTHVVDQVFLLVERTSVVCVMGIVEAALVVIGCGLGLALGGAAGAAVGVAGGCGVSMIAGFAFAQMRTDLDLPLRGAALVVVAVAAMAAGLRLIPFGFVPGGATGEIVAKIVVGVAIYGAGVILLFPSLRRWVVGHWRRRREQALAG